MPSATSSAIEHLVTGAVADELAAACVALGLPLRPLSSTPGAGAVIVCELPPGARRIPSEISDRNLPADVQLVLCAQDATVRPISSIVDGKVVLVGPPHGCDRFVTALRTLVPTTGSSLPSLAPRAEMLLRDRWLASARGPNATALDVAHDDQRGSSVVLGSSPLTAAEISALLHESVTDARREAVLWEQLGVDAAVVHLSPTADDWLVYWPTPDQALLLCSSQRLPPRWAVSAGMVAARRRLLRIPAYPRDLVLAGQVARGMSAALRDAITLGGADTFAALRAELGDDGAVCVVEVR